MKEIYNIVVELMTSNGLIEIGKFYAGNEKDFAINLFDSLEGVDINEHQTMLRMDLRIKKDNFQDTNIKSFGCSLDQYNENCKKVILTMFRQIALENDALPSSD